MTRLALCFLYNTIIIACAIASTIAAERYGERRGRRWVIKQAYNPGKN